ncbi:YheC/YheD family protein [Psychrobacillus sp. FJAT-51614]|uniref:YheC/YheD family protein n=1 Tax=Psychrobacillus mangrovi TaxID=3117745 RepID=A0ABU8F2B0_9BACI
MTLIGMLHHRAEPEKVKKAYAYAVVAKAEGVDFFYFTAGNVDIKNEKILGKYYENGKWNEKEYPFPDAIYNASFPLTYKGELAFDYLFKRIPFTSHSIGNKSEVQYRIKKGKEFYHYLIPTMELTNEKDLLDMIEMHNQIIIKPVSGSRGSGILFVEKADGETFKMNDSGKISFFSKQDLIDLVLLKVQEQDYIIQKFISSRIKSGQVFDFRLHVQKNGEGEWVTTSIYPRVGPVGSITSNLGNGGFTAFPDPFLQIEFDNEWFDVKKTLEYFSVSFSKHFDSLYGDFYLDELGIDVGMDENQRIWLFEVNWRPGIPVIFNGELDVAKNTIQYAKFLANNNKNLPS